MTPKQRKAVEQCIRDTHSIHGKGMIIAIVWGVPYAGVDQSRHGMTVYQMQYGMRALNFSVALDFKTVHYLHRDRLVLSPRINKRLRGSVKDTGL